MRLILASRNEAKVRELARILTDLPVGLETLHQHPEVPAFPEDGDTYEANAISKATTVARWTGTLALADDSGVEVGAMGGGPGVFSARFLGASASDADRNAEILRRLSGVSGPARAARYRAVIAVAHPDGRVRTFVGACEGIIVDAPRGQRGFGYDPIFSATGDGRTVAELSEEEKDRISHRGAALRQARVYLKGLVEAASTA